MNKHLTEESKKNISAYISLGSNSGDALQNLATALEKIKQYHKGTVQAASSIYSTEPQGDKDQNWFYNQLIRLDFHDLCDISPSAPQSDLLFSGELNSPKPPHSVFSVNKIHKKNENMRFPKDIMSFGGEFERQNLSTFLQIEREAHLLLDFLLDTEKKMGRERDPARRFGPRSIDLDIILFGNQIINNEKLTVPHPRFLERAFILIPLQEIAPGIILDKINIKDALDKLIFRIDGNKIYQ